jgi:peptidoglycan/LPS O-acetylase OafA/YrhL
LFRTRRFILTLQFSKKEARYLLPFPFFISLEAQLNRQAWTIWKNRLMLILPVILGVVAAVVGVRMLILRDFSDSSWEFMGRCGADALGFFLVAGLGWLQTRDEFDRGNSD